MSTAKGPSAPWPRLDLARWEESAVAFQLVTQVIGKTRLALEPLVNHWWQVPLYVTARGFTTSLMPAGQKALEVNFDVRSWSLQLLSTDGAEDGFPLDVPHVAAFYSRFFEGLRRLGVEVSIHPLAVEIKEAVYLDRDETPRPLDRAWTQALHAVLVQAHRLFTEFRAGFVGKVSPVHFFWGSSDLAVTRFSGRPAPLHPGGAPHCADWVMQEAYSHEVSSAGFWPGNHDFPEAVFYSYAYPEPEGFSSTRVVPAGARYEAGLREFVLPYETVRRSDAPDMLVRAFLESTYAAAAELAEWPRETLERRTAPGGRPSPEPSLEATLRH